MKFLTAILVAIVTFAGSLAANAAVSQTLPATKAAKPAALPSEVLIEVRHLETKSRKKRKKRKKTKSRGQSLKAIRNEAIRDTINGLGELRPFTTNFNRLKAAVRRYWKRNISRPSARGLTNTIMRHVKRKSRKLVRSEVYSGAKSGVRKVKRALRKRK